MPDNDGKLDILPLHGADPEELRAKARHKIQAGEFPAATTGVVYQPCDGTWTTKHAGWCSLCGEQFWWPGEIWWRLEESGKAALELHARCYSAWYGAVADLASET